MARAFAKISVHKKGGAANAEYIGRPQERPDAERSPEDDPVWTWNAPQCVTGDTYGIEENKQAQEHLKNGVRPSLIPPSQPVLQSGQTLKLSIDEKRQNAISYFSILAELEERKGGVSHFRLILTVGPEVTNGQMKMKVNAFLGENFPLARAMVAIHRDTEHTHAHLHVHVRQIDDKRINLGQKYFQLDESWMKICSEHLRDSEIYDKHVALKKVTLEWKEQAEEARSKRESIPPKDDRWSDHHETFLRFQPWDNRWCGRLMAQTRVAEKRVEFLTVTEATKNEIMAATREAQWLRERLETAAEKRRSSARNETKRQMPAEIITVSEARDLATFARAIERNSRDGQPEASTSIIYPTRHQSQSTVNKQGALIFEDQPTTTVEQSIPEPDHFGKAEGFIGIASQNPRLPEPPLKFEGERTDVASLSTIPQTDMEIAAKVLGRELVAEARMDYTEYCIGRTKARKEQKQLKEQLKTARVDYAQAHAEAEQYRSLFESQGMNAPWPELTSDEKSYLTVIAKFVAEPLRERIVTEVDRVQMASANRDYLKGKQKDESRPSVAITHPAKKRTVRRPHSSEKQLDFNLELLDHSAMTPSHPVLRQQNIVVTQGGNSPKMSTGVLTDHNLSRLIVRAELAEAQLIVLRAEEAEFTATPHRWLSPTRGISLKEVEEQISAHKRAGKIEALTVSKADIQKEIAVERVALRERRQKAEYEVGALNAHISQAKTARANLNLPTPLVRWTAEDVHELAACAESAREPRLFKRAYEIERDRMLRDTQASPDKIALRQLEAKYIGLELKADIKSNRSERLLARALHHPEKLMLPALDGNGRDIAVPLEQIQPQKGIKGLLKRVAEAPAERQFRQQLEQAKESYLNHLRTRCETDRAYYETAREVADECRERGKELGFIRHAAPDLSREELSEIENYARAQMSPRGQYWLFLCNQAGRQLDQKSGASRVTPTEPEPQRQPYTVPEDIQQHRAKLEKDLLNRIGEKIRERKNAPTRPELVPLDPERANKQRGGGGRRR